MPLGRHYSGRVKILLASPFVRKTGSFLGRLARDRAGNTLALVAAAILPLLAMVGGGVDLGRSYLSQSRLQQACDAGVLAARKRLGSQAVVTGDIPEDAASIGNRFFNVNFQDGTYGTYDRAFAMTLEEDYSISAVANVIVPTTIMQIFGYAEVPVEVECQAQISVVDTDVMMVLDVTGSMGTTNPGDEVPRIAALRETVRNFHAQLAAAAAAGTRIRYGFVPYSTNVNVGGLLEDEWVTPEWTYQSRVIQKDDPETPKWKYQSLTLDVSDWRETSNGCIEERGTYEIGDYDNVDLDRALDLDIDRVPSPGDPDTQWRPQFPDIIFARNMTYDGKGSFKKNGVTVSAQDFVSPATLGTAACPPPARKLGEMDTGEIETYLAGLQPGGHTYHDIGMIWGGRLLSPSGIFASENADRNSGIPTSRHLIFLTDGETSTLDLSYSSYGLEPLDSRRWKSNSSLSLNETVEKRFAFACSEVRKKNITVWVIGFGTALSDVMKECAGEGHYFEAADAQELNVSFSAIAKKMSELRVVR